MGEGGAILSDNEQYMDRCRSYHNFGRLNIAGTKLCLAEYQAAIGLAQLKRLDEQTTKRNECPLNEWACNEENVSFGQRMLLAERSDMDVF